MTSVEDPPFPLGVPTACFVHLDDGPSPTATAATDAGGGKVAIDGRPHEVDGVFDARLDKDDDVFQEVLEIATEDTHRPVPLQVFVEDAVSFCTLVVGTHLSSKRDLFQGPDDGEDSLGMLGWAFDSIFQLLRDKAFGIQEGYYEFNVDVAFYEIFDEMITDLLKPDNLDLQVRLHHIRGFEVEGLSRTRVHSPQDGRRAIKAGKKNRRTQVLPNGPAQESASAVLQIGLTQREGESQDQYRHLHSVALFVEVPSTHKLVSTPDDLRITQGPTLNRSLLAFKDVAKALASEKQIRFAPFSDGRLTEVLQTSLGGNAIVLVIACLSRSDTIKVNTTTWAMIQNLQAAMHYPVANTELIQGVVLKYQFMLANALGGRGIVGGGRGAGADGAVNAQRMRALEGQVLQAKMESNESKEDAAKVYKMLELFKAKYVKLVETKSSQSMELISAEEGKLAVSRSLLDLKLEHSKLLEKFESDRYALTTDLLAAKNEVVELEMGLQESEAVRDAKEREATTAVADREAMQKKLRDAETMAKELQDKFGTEEAKSVEMAAELLTLVNQKAHLETVRADLERQVEDFSGRVRMLELDLRTAREEMRGLKEDTEAAQKLAGVLEVAKSKAELDLQRAQVEWETQELENRRSAVTGDQTREAELLKNHMQDLEQLAKMKEDNAALKKQHDHLRLEVKQTERRREQAREETARKEEDLEQCRAELAEATEELDSLRHKFRDQLENFVSGKAGGKASRKRNKDDRSASVDASKRAALEEMIRSYKEREEKATGDARHWRDEARDAKLKNRALFDRYAQLRGILEDSLGAGELPPDLPSDEKLIAAGAAASAGTSGGPDADAHAALKARLNVAESELSAQQEKHLLVAEEYSELIKNLEERQREDSQKIGMLESENKALSKSLENTGGDHQQLQEMQAMVMKMAAAKAEPVCTGRPSASAEGSRDMRIRVKQAEDERDNALDEVAALRLQQDRRGGSGAKENMELMAEIERVERINAELTSNKATLEGELTRFKEYTRETVARYQDTIRQLQKELKMFKGG
eukprot:g11653.t1